MFIGGKVLCVIVRHRYMILLKHILSVLLLINVSELYIEYVTMLIYSNNVFLFFVTLNIVV